MVANSANINNNTVGEDIGIRESSSVAVVAVAAVTSLASEGETDPFHSSVFIQNKHE